MLTVLDLFSGIGGISLGLESTGGFRTVAFCEIEPFPRAVLRKHWPTVPIHEDVRTLTAESLGGLRPDCIVGGFPCQDISVAGKGAGLDGKRSGLWSEYARLVGELRPRWIVAENVGALRTRGVDRVCSDLEGEGYTVWSLLVGAWAVGAPHRRERVWIMARLAQPSGGRLEKCAIPKGPWRGGPRAMDSFGTSTREFRNAASGHDADGRGERPVGSPTGSGLEGQRADAGESQESQSGDAGVGYSTGARQLRAQSTEHDRQDGAGRDHSGQDAQSSCANGGVPRWPARPGEPQHEWEEPRLAYGEGLRSSRPATERDAPRPQLTGSSAVCGERARSDGLGSVCWCGAGSERSGWYCNAEAHSQRPELPLGGPTDGLPSRLVRLARRANREALKAYGNSVVPQVIHAIGRAILEAEKAQ